MSLTRDEEQITQIIDKVLEARERMVRREIGWFCCGTSYDNQKIHAAQEKYETAYRAAIQEILHLIVYARRMP